jgi:hypothetical protein
MASDIVQVYSTDYWFIDFCYPKSSDSAGLDLNIQNWWFALDQDILDKMWGYVDICLKNLYQKGAGIVILGFSDVKLA